MKKIIVFILTLVLLVNTFLVSASAGTDTTSSTGVTPRWTNCATVDTTFGVANGVAECFIDYFADEALFTHAVIRITIEKRFLLAFWKDVGEWSTTSYEHSAMFGVDIPVDGKGKYRCHFYLEVYGNTGAVDVIESTETYDYDG